MSKNDIVKSMFWGFFLFCFHLFRFCVCVCFCVSFFLFAFYLGYIMIHIPVNLFWVCLNVNIGVQLKKKTL